MQSTDTWAVARYGHVCFVMLHFEVQFSASFFFGRATSVFSKESLSGCAREKCGYRPVRIESKRTASRTSSAFLWSSLAAIPCLTFGENASIGQTVLEAKTQRWFSRHSYPFAASEAKAEGVSSERHSNVWSAFVFSKGVTLLVGFQNIGFDTAENEPCESYRSLCTETLSDYHYNTIT